METKISIPGTGAVRRTVTVADAQLIGFAAAVAPFDFTKSSNLPQPPDQDQNGSGSCTAQAAGNKFWLSTGIMISRRDPYSHTFMPGGGAYLVSPFDWLNGNGYLDQGKFPEPNPESEQAMETIIQVQDGDRVRTFQVQRIVSPVISIDAAAQIIDQYKGVVIGICGSWSKGWNGSWTDPSYQGQDDWQHALCGFDHVMRNGKKTIACKSSWCDHVDFLGQPSKVHYINEDYFNAGGVFEILAVSIREITNMEQHFKVNIGGRAGLFHVYGDGGWFEVAANEQEYHDMGVKYNVDTCDLVNGKWVFQPFDFEK